MTLASSIALIGAVAEIVLLLWTIYRLRKIGIMIERIRVSVSALAGQADADLLKAYTSDKEGELILPEGYAEEFGRET